MIKSVRKFMNGINKEVVNIAGSRPVRKLSSAFSKAAKTTVESTAGGTNKVLNAGKKAASSAKNVVGKINKESIGQATDKVITSSLSDATSYNMKNAKHPNILHSNKFLAADAIGTKARQALDVTAGVVSPFVKKAEDGTGFLGMKANALGIGTLAAVHVAGGTPEAAKQWQTSRQGTSYDNQAQRGVAPQTPAYANNAGATGDLTLALNNLRHGGMM